MGKSRPAKRILAFATAALLSGVAAPRAQAQESDWLEVRGSTALTLRKGESRSYEIRLKQPPRRYDRQGNLRDTNGNIVTEIADAALDDGWWVRVIVGGGSRADGLYDVDEDRNTGYDDPTTEEQEGYDIRWVPSVGREFDSHDGNGRKWDKWRDITITALSDVDEAVVFTHEVWANSTFCPEHEKGRVGVTITDESEPGVRMTRTAFDVQEGGSDTYDVVLLSKPTGNVRIVRITISGHSGSDLTLDDTTLDFTDQNWTVAQTVTVKAEEDPDADADDPVTLTHSASGGGYGGVDIEDVTVTIVDDDTASDRVTLIANPARVSESRGSSGETVTVTGQLNGATRATATVVTVSVRPGTGANAAQTDDFTAVTPFTLTIQPNRANGTRSFTFLPENDTEDEGDETVEVSGTSDLTVTPAELTILDDDGPPDRIELSVNLRMRTVSESDPVQAVVVTATLVGGGSLAEDTIVDVDVGEGKGTAILDSDYTATDPGMITIRRGQFSGTGTFMLDPLEDEDQTSETFDHPGPQTVGNHSGPPPGRPDSRAQGDVRHPVQCAGGGDARGR